MDHAVHVQVTQPTDDLAHNIPSIRLNTRPTHTQRRLMHACNTVLSRAHLGVFSQRFNVFKHVAAVDVLNDHPLGLVVL